MTRTLIVVDDLRHWKPYSASEGVISADDYLFGEPGRAGAETRVINLCQSYRYLSTGYYVSLLAEARKQRVLPTVRTINDLSRKAIYGLETEDLDELLQRPLARSGTAPGDRLTLDIFFGTTPDPRFGELARQIFDAFSAPLLQVELRHQGRWRIASLRTLALPRLTVHQQGAFAEALDRFSGDVWRRPRARRRYRYDLAILHNPQEQLPPSNARALRNFQRVGRQLGIAVDLLTPKEFGRLAEYDALFIRETTAISDHTYRFAKKAEAEGMVVMDDPDSILRCTNKVYLADLLATHRVPTPATRILHKGRPADLAAAGETLGFPMVLKIPDGSFSRGVVKVPEPAELPEAAARLFERSDLILAQEFLVSDYDWRIGVLNGRPFYACQYFFPKGHWQIVQHGADGRVREGGSRTIAASDAPRAVLKVATRAAGLIGNGLYGVDVKQSGERAVVIEVNDNPNLDAGVEDGYLGDDLYRMILEEFIRRLERKRSLLPQA
ncbi:RimK family protein [Sediminicurvatus halobius]|uniref:RimK family alpha-L-glutamate ligase n=1 Tax=Sediminicurvatus halobius TaxID=2182432 RepID=A0A2U2MW93_9GAMM|nr:RimK family protein [Spiribacter halobius]PWG61082.1 RimK family alpha-L-glutamate ligase [Spiribacter halobius]UEX77108.1 RimK family protein [Spiribacter halobius]